MDAVGGFTVEQVIKIFFQTCAAVTHLHKQKPSIIHRDLKVIFKDFFDKFYININNFFFKFHKDSLKITNVYMTRFIKCLKSVKDTAKFFLCDFSLA